MEKVTERCWVISKGKCVASKEIMKPWEIRAQNTRRVSILNTSREVKTLYGYSWFHRDAGTRYSWDFWTQHYVMLLRGPFIWVVYCAVLGVRSHVLKSKVISHLPHKSDFHEDCDSSVLCVSPHCFPPNVELNTQHSSKSWIDDLPWRLDFLLLWR